MVKIQVGLKSCSFHRRIQWRNSFCPTRPPLAGRAKNVSKISAQLWSPRAKLSLSSPRARRKTSSLVTSRREKKNFVFRHLAHRTARGDQWRSFSVSARWRKTEFSARWPKLCTYFRDIFGSPGQEEPSWAKWVSPLNSSVKTTTFKPNLYFYHRIPLTNVNSRFLISFTLSRHAEQLLFSCLSSKVSRCQVVHIVKIVKVGPRLKGSCGKNTSWA